MVQYASLDSHVRLKKVVNILTCSEYILWERRS